jgi:hypothetical protein
MYSEISPKNILPSKMEKEPVVDYYLWGCPQDDQDIGDTDPEGPCPPYLGKPWDRREKSGVSKKPTASIVIHYTSLFLARIVQPGFISEKHSSATSGRKVLAAVTACRICSREWRANHQE